MQDGLADQIVMWNENWLDGQVQKVAIEAMKPSWRSESSSVNQGSTPGPILFSIFVNYLGHNGPLTRCADGTKQEGVTDTSDSCARETSTGWRNGLTGISSSSTRARAKTCIRGRTAPGTTQIRHNSRVSSWKAACKEPVGHKDQHQPAKGPCSKGY